LRLKAGNVQTSDQGVLEVIAGGGITASLSENAVGELDLTLTGSEFSLASNIAAGATTADLGGSLADIQLGQLLAFGVGTSTCEARRVTAIAGSTVTLHAAFKWTHTAGQTIRLFNFWASPTWWGAVPGDSTFDSFRNLSNMLLDSQQSVVAYGILGPGGIGNAAFYSSRPLWFPDGTKLVELSLIAKSPFGLDATLGIWGYDSNWPHQHFLHAAGQFGTVSSIDTAANSVTFNADPGAVSGEPVAFYVREGLGTIPGGLEEGRTYYTIEASGATRTLSIDKWGTTPVDITSVGSGEICYWSPGNTRLNTDRVFVSGNSIPGLSGLYCILQQPSHMKDLRLQTFANVGVTLGGQQSVWTGPEIVQNGRIGMRMSGAEWVNIHGGDFEGNGLVNLDFLDMAVYQPIGTPANAANFNVAIYGCHFEGYGSRGKLLQTITITGVPSAGTFTLNGQTLNWNADATAIQTACDAAFGVGNCVVTGGPLPGAQVTLTFQGIYQFAFGPTVTIVNSITGGSYVINTVRPDGRNISLKGGKGIYITGCVDSAATKPDGMPITFLVVEGAGASSVLNADYILQSIFAIGGTVGANYFVEDPLRRNLKREDGNLDGAAQILHYYAAGGRHGGAIGRHWWLAGDGGRYAVFGSAGAPTWELGGAASQADPYFKVKMGATPGANANPYEARDSTDALLYSVDNKGLVKPPASRPKLATPTYSASITPDASAGEWQTITVTNGTAFTINAPTSPPTAAQSQDLTIEVLNSSGGAMGVITWNAAYVFAAGAWTNPASTKKRYVTFRWNGASWIAGPPATTDY
jgi:hypothetical protein